MDLHGFELWLCFRENPDWDRGGLNRRIGGWTVWNGMDWDRTIYSIYPDSYGRRYKGAFSIASMVFLFFLCAIWVTGVASFDGRLYHTL